MFLRKLITATVVAILLVGCGKHSVTVSEVEFNDEKVYVDGHPFTGTVWSDDNATWQLTANEGTPTAVTFYHDGGTVAYSMESSSDTTDFRTYDEEGTLIPIDTFVEHYKDLASEIPALLQLIKGESID
ncbi:MAG: hypothetical protein J6Y97_10365 [Prevotella sp.]|nr:hypothetical protein [Prevotella sp.]MBP5506737.1 hypothetical protein [Prevotella sp.]